MHQPRAMRSARRTRAPRSPPHAAWYAQIRGACDRLRYVSVRNATTEHLLRRCGVTRPIAHIPDVAIAYTPDADTATEHGADGLLARGTRPLVGLSVGRTIDAAATAAFADALLSTLDGLAAGGARSISCVFPFGGVYGDAAFARSAARRLPHARLL